MLNVVYKKGQEFFPGLHFEKLHIKPLLLLLFLLFSSTMLLFVIIRDMVSLHHLLFLMPAIDIVFVFRPVTGL